MPALARHIIQRQTVWLDQPPQLSPRLPAFVLQERLSVYCRNTLPGVLESVFDGIADANTIIRLGTLDLDAGTISPARFEEQLTQRIRQRAEQELNRLLNNRELGDTPVERYSRTDRLGEQFWFFLHHGYLPAWADTEAVIQFSDWLTSTSAEAFRNEIRAVLPGNSSIARRLISHSSDTALMSLFSPAAGSGIAEKLSYLVDSIHQTISYLPASTIREQYWLSRFRAVGAGDLGEHYLTDFYTSLHRLNGLAKGLTESTFFFVTLFQCVDSGTKTMLSSDRNVFLKPLQQLINQAASHRADTTKQPDRETLTGTESTSELTSRPEINTDTRSDIDPLNADPATARQNPSATEDDNRSHPKTTDSGELIDAELTGPSAKSAGSTNQPNVADEPRSDNQPVADQPYYIGATTNQPAQSSSQTGPVHDPPRYADSLEPLGTNQTDSVAKSAQKPTKQNRPETPLPDSEIYVSMAGIVLLHPFLSILFTEMGLVHNCLWVSPEASAKGVQVLTWLATGKTFCAEYTMPLLKLLCGLPMETVVSPDIRLTDTEKQLTTEVLEAVLTHWTVLKNTSTAGLQEAFLQREGKLTAVDGGWRLSLERKTIDILLDKLPWGVSMVKLPWMPDLLFVDWI